MIFKSRFFSTLALGLIWAGVASTQIVDLESLLREMTDLDRLTRLPSPRYVTRQCSSYDQNSTDPGDPTEGNWFANYDRNQYLRVEEKDGRTEYVLMDAAGPGAVVRFWSANPREGGIVRFYLDHNAEPVIEMPLYTLLSGWIKPFVSPLSGERGKGWNCYFPIPYAKHCKITVSESDIYYHINYRSYEAGTAATTFSMGQAELVMAQVRATAAALAAPDGAVDAPGETEDYAVDLAPGAEESVLLSGPGAISRLACRASSADLEAALRGCVLEIAFDGQAPSVLAPLGDFFGTAPGANPYLSLPSGVQEDGALYAHWVMPFEQEARLRVVNHSAYDVWLEGEIRVVERPWTEDSLYFHAKWRAEKDMSTRPFQDWNYLGVEGAGRFVGVMLHMANPATHWWGEGDEKIYVDGESFPSHFGTGTEDYYGYAWCDTALFTHAYHNQSRCDGPANRGHSCVSRFHIMDDIPFTRSFRFDMELWHWAEVQVTQAVTAWWYAAPGAADNTPSLDQGLLVVPEIPEIQGVAGAIEGETLKVISVSGGEAAPQSGAEWSWSRGEQLWWRGGKPGDRLVLGFTVETGGAFELLAAFTKAPDYGIHRLTINGELLGDPMDFYAEKGSIDAERSLGVFTLPAGENLLEIEIVDANPQAEKAYMFGLDYLRIEER